MKNKEIIIAIQNFIDNMDKKYDMRIWNLSVKQEGCEPEFSDKE